MFPILPKYLSHVHVVNGAPVQVDSDVHENILRRYKKARNLYIEGVKIINTDINRLEKLMLAEAAKDADKSIVAVEPISPKEPIIAPAIASKPTTASSKPRSASPSASPPRAKTSIMNRLEDKKEEIKRRDKENGKESAERNHSHSNLRSKKGKQDR